MKGERVGAGGWGWPRGLVRVTGPGGGAWDLRSHPGRALILLVTETEVNW